MSAVTAAELFKDLSPALQDLFETPENTSLQTLREKLGFKGPEDCMQFELITALKQIGIRAQVSDLAKIAQITQLVAIEQEQSSSFRP